MELGHESCWVYTYGLQLLFKDGMWISCENRNSDTAYAPKSLLFLQNRENWQWYNAIRFSFTSGWNKQSMGNDTYFARDNNIITQVIKVSGIYVFHTTSRIILVVLAFPPSQYHIKILAYHCNNNCAPLSTSYAIMNIWNFNADFISWQDGFLGFPDGLSEIKSWMRNYTRYLCKYSPMPLAIHLN